uniref:Disease resistance R13L4/SHOC-2-like LRR domain-containing protein n=1 Tax=Oryza glumipatula TaxID=40148 RepID=A0A0E0A3D9_9ORYZ
MQQAFLERATKRSETDSDPDAEMGAMRTMILKVVKDMSPSFCCNFIPWQDLVEVENQERKTFAAVDEPHLQGERSTLAARAMSSLSWRTQSSSVSHSTSCNPTFLAVDRSAAAATATATAIDHAGAACQCQQAMSMPPLLNRLDTVDRCFAVAALSTSDLGGIKRKLGREMRFLELWWDEIREKFYGEFGQTIEHVWFPIGEIRRQYRTLAASQDTVEILHLMERMRDTTHSLLKHNTRPGTGSGGDDEIAAELPRRDDDDELSLVSLRAHLTSIIRLLTDAIVHEDACEAKLLLDKIRAELGRLEGAFNDIHQSEKTIEGSFGAVQHLVDELLLDAAAAPVATSSRQDQLRCLIAALSSVDREVAAITDRVNDTFRLSTAAAAAAAATPAARAASSCWGGALESSWETRRHLQLAMDSLDTRLKRCLLCFVVFPDDAAIKRRLLIHWWVGERLVDSVDQGKEVFDELVSSTGFVTPLRRPHCSKVHGCKIQPWVRVLLVACARRNAFLDLDANGMPRDDFARTRRSCLREGRTVASGAGAGGFRRDVTTIYNVDRRYVDLDKSWFARKEELTTLQLGTWRDHGYDPRAHHVELINGELLRGIGACRNMRYLSFRGISRIEALPDSIGGLCSLIVLDLRSCHNLATLGEGIKSLVSLEYLDGIEKLSKLQVIKGFVVANSSSKDLCRLSELRTLTRLRKLSIVIGRTARPEADEVTALASLPALRSLTMTWSGVSPAEQDGRDATDKVAFALSSELEKLDLRCFPLPDFPRWAEPHLLPRQEKLYVRGGMITGLGEGGGGSAVKVLRVRFLRHLDYSWEKLHDAYGKLEILEVCECSNVQAWPACRGGLGLWRKGEDC